MKSQQHDGAHQRAIGQVSKRHESAVTRRAGNPLEPWEVLQVKAMAQP